MTLALVSNLFGPDMLVVGLIVLLLFGAKKLPELARGLGQSLNEFKKAREDFEHELRQAQVDPQAREAGNRQPYTGMAAAPPTQSLPYTAPMAMDVTSTPVESAEALRQKVEQLQRQLRELEAQKSEVPQAPV